MHKYDSAFYYEDLATSIKDSLYGIPKFKQLQLLMLSEQKRQQKIEQEQERYKNKTRMIALWSTVGVFLIIAFILYRNNRQKQKTNNALESTLSNLKATQHQLIQSEKMASLGELTAGIAHEIQNPLNFVNNFSEVNKELLTEMREEIANKNFEEVDKIARDVEENEEKIIHHGKRADAIVKGMLQHSRSSSGVKEPTDINALADEYLRLAYHGLRAKDKSFNATMKTDYDESLEKVNVIPQDIGRVILNLITNAFYVVNEKQKQLASTSSASSYEPIVMVSTKTVKPPSGGLGVEIRVADNGKGIPQKVLDKLLQPFFTTKPTGQGTGLGLSLSYDIIKAHGGELLVETKDREGAEFIIHLPIG
jgi:signal transduction histidine kinase